MVHETETQSPAINPASAVSTRRKRLILLSSEDLRPIACSLEDALRSRGWEVDLELGASAKPWIQQVPPVRPSLRVLCVPGSVDPSVARQLRAAYRPDADADLHIVGMDAPGLVQEIERLAGVETPRRRSLYASPRLAHPTVVETQFRRERNWLIGATSALAAFAITLGGITMVQHSASAPELSLLPTASIATPIASPLSMPDEDEVEDDERSRFDDPVFAAVAPFTSDAWDEGLEDDDEIVILLDDELDVTPEPERKTVGTARDVAAPPLAEPSSTIEITDAVTEPLEITTAPTLPALPSGSVSVAGLPTTDSDVSGPVARQLPRGFLPVAGMIPPPSVTVDPFVAGTSASTPMGTVDPFATNASTPMGTVDPFATIDAATP